MLILLSHYLLFLVTFYLPLKITLKRTEDMMPFQQILYINMIFK